MLKKNKNKKKGTKGPVKQKVKKTKRQKSKRRQSAKSKVKKVYQADSTFDSFAELRALIIKALPDSFPKLERGLKKIGRVRLALVTGIFFNLPETRVDILIVVDRVNLKKFANLIKDIETSIGKEIRYVIWSSDEFLYRYEMFDRFLRDILDYPHQKLINRLKV